MSNLVPLLREGVREGSERKVYLRADARAKYGEVKAVLDQIRLAGIENVAFMTVEAPHKPAP
jgi:biopolymer transport protein ExbD